MIDFTQHPGQRVFHFSCRIQFSSSSIVSRLRLFWAEDDISRSAWNTYQAEGDNCSRQMWWGRSLPWVGRPAGPPGSSLGPGGAGHSAWPPRGPGASPPVAASHWLPPPPGTPPWPGSAARDIRITYMFQLKHLQPRRQWNGAFGSYWWVCIFYYSEALKVSPRTLN